MAELEATIKKDFMVKRSLMKGRIIKTESYKGRWFILSINYLRYCDGSIEVGPTVSSSCRTVDRPQIISYIVVLLMMKMVMMVVAPWS